MTSQQWAIIFFSVRMALLSTLLLSLPAIALAWLLARRDWRGKSVVETLITIPLVAPPVATGLVLLRIFGKRNGIGSWLADRGMEVVFTWRGVVIAMMVMSAQLLVRTARVAFEAVDAHLEGMARTLGASRLRAWMTITLPLAARGLVAGALLAFARALGEFGATILVAGNLPGRTTTISVAMYDAIQLGDDATAIRLLVSAVVIAFFAVWLSDLFARPARRVA
jgi:molybdate transport system permease protein